MGYARPWGNAAALTRVCGEALGADEAHHGVPFVGQAGVTLFKAMRAAGVPSERCSKCGGSGGWVNRDDYCLECRGSGRDFSHSVYIYNTVQCRPPANNFAVVERHSEEIPRCQEKYVAPAPEGSVTFLVGGSALKWLHDKRMTSIEVWSGSRLQSGTSFAIPTLHPSYLNRQPKLTATLANDIHSGLKRHPLLYPKWGSVEPGPLLAVDVECDSTMWPTVVGVSTDGEYVEQVDPNDDQGMAHLQRLLDAAERILAHNALFDVQMLEKLRLRVLRGKVVCTMQAWHFLQPDLDQGLDDAARFVLSGRTMYWKGLGRKDAAKWKPLCEELWDEAVPDRGGFSTRDDFYNAIDVQATWHIWTGIAGELNQQQRLEDFEQIVMPAARCFWEIEEGGMYVDQERLGEWRVELAAKVKAASEALTKHPLVYHAVEERGRVAREELGRLEVNKQMEWFRVNKVRLDAVAVQLRLKREIAGTEDKADKKRLRAELKAIKLPKMVRKSSLTPLIQKQRTRVEQAETVKFEGPQKLWLVYEVLKCPKQLAERKRKDGSKVKTLSADERSLNKLLTLKGVSDEAKAVIRLLLAHEEASHLLTSFASLKVEADGKIYPRIRIATATGRASSGADEDEKGGGSPTNAQNWPLEMRDIIVPDPGQVLVHWDWSQQEWLLQLHFAGDHEALERTRSGAEDRHLVAARALYGKEDITPEERKKAKVMNYGLAYGMGVEKFMAQFGVSSKREAEEIIGKLKAAYPKVLAWQTGMLAEARRTKQLQTAFGWRRYFYRYDPNKAAAFLPSATGAGMMQLRLPLLAQLARDNGGRIITSTHDSFDASVPPENAAKMEALGAQILEYPFKRLGGLWCSVGSKQGKNWREACE